MIIKHHKGYLQSEDIEEIGRMFEKCTASHNSYQNQDTTLLLTLFESSVFKKLKASILRDHYVCEAWFIIGETYTWHTDAHVDLFSDKVMNLWIPYELSTETDSPLLEYYDENDSSRKRVRDSRNLIRSLIIIRWCATRLSSWVDLRPVVERLFAKVVGGQLRSVRQAEIGDVLVLDPSFLHRSGTRKKKVLAIQCVPGTVLKDPSVCYRHSAITSLAARKALAAIFLQGQQESNANI